ELEHDVRRPQHPALGEPRRRRHVLRIAPRAPCFGPGLEHGDVRRRERAVVLELRPDTRGGLPGRHPPFGDHRGDIRGALAGLLVRHQREGADLIATMAGLALLLEDRGHILGERRRPGAWAPIPARRHGRAQPANAGDNPCPPRYRPDGAMLHAATFSKPRVMPAGAWGPALLPIDSHHAYDGRR